MTFNIIINTLALGFVTWICGIEEKKDWKKIVGAAIVGATIIYNTLNSFGVVG